MACTPLEALPASNTCEGSMILSSGGGVGVDCDGRGFKEGAGVCTLEVDGAFAEEEGAFAKEGKEMRL